MNNHPLLPSFFASGPPLSATAESLGDSFVWDDLIQAARNELVLPALSSRLAALGLSQRTPSPVADFLSAVEQLNAERNKAIFAELAAVAQLLNKIGVEPVLLKGAAYCATGVYPNPAARYIWDIDLLLPDSHLDLAVATLRQNSFETNPDDQLGYFRHHHPPLSRNGAIAFELHRSLGMGVCPSLLPAQDVLAHSIPLDFHGTRVRVPSPTHLAAHLIMHSQIQHPYNERIWPPLRALYDLLLVRNKLDAQIDWSEIQSRFRNTGQSAVLALHLLQLQESLGVPPPFPIYLTGFSRMRKHRRGILRAAPVLRFFDPFYMLSVVFLRRLRLSRNAVNANRGWRSIAKELFTPGLYKRIVTDIIEGHGR